MKLTKNIRIKRKEDLLLPKDIGYSKLNPKGKGKKKSIWEKTQDKF